MHREKRALLYLLLMFVFLVGSWGFTSAAVKGDSRNKWELGIGVDLNVSFLDTTYQTSYSPLFKYSGVDDYLSAAAQVLNFTPQKNTELGTIFTVNYLLTEKIGIQLFGEFHKTSIGGTGNFFYSFLQYTDCPYPSMVPTLYTIEKNESWPDTIGTLKQSTLSLDMMARFNLGMGFNFDISGGPSFFFLNGEASSIGYLFWTTSHFMRVEFNYPIKFSFKPSMKLGLNIGGELDILLLPHTVFFLTARFFYSPIAASEIELKEIFRFEVNIRDCIDEIMSTMNLQPIKINPSFLIFGTGIKIRF